jgi:hypothetical protein
MRKLDTSLVSSSVAMPIKSGTLVHVQLAYQEALTALANSIIGRLPDSGNMYVLYGCVNSGSGLNYVISAGAVYYNGEVFLVDATTFTATSGQVAVSNLGTTYYSTYADPVTFTDGSANNVHQIRKMVFTAGTSGSGIVDFSAMLQVPQVLVNDQQASLPASYTVNFKQDKATFFNSAPNSAVTITFDFTNAVPGTVVRLKWSFGAGATLTINQPTGSTIIRDSGNLSSVASANNLLYFMYCGVNSSGLNEVSYTLKQF